MLCSICNSKEAVCERSVDSSVGKIKTYLCLECLQKISSPIEESSHVSDFWNKDNKEIVCSNCGTSLEKFLNSNYVGCAKCYENFDADIERVVVSIHGKCSNVGKVPERIFNQNVNKYTKKSAIDRAWDPNNIEYSNGGDKNWENKIYIKMSLLQAELE